MTAMRWLVAGTLLLAGCAESPPPSSPEGGRPPIVLPDTTATDDRGALSTRHWVDHVQRCGERCGYRKRGKSVISVDLWKDGRAEVSAEGELLETFRATTGKRRQVTEWKRRWIGRWQETGQDRMQISLEQDALTCDRERDDGATDQPCNAIEKLVLRCERLRVRLSSRRASSEASWTWTCRAKPSDSIDFPMLPWVFSDDGKVAAVDVGVDESWDRKYLRPKGDRPIRLPPAK